MRTRTLPDPGSVSNRRRLWNWTKGDVPCIPSPLAQRVMYFPEVKTLARTGQLPRLSFRANVEAHPAGHTDTRRVFLCWP